MFLALFFEPFSLTEDHLDFRFAEILDGQKVPSC
jgi:hypothetical protein